MRQMAKLHLTLLSLWVSTRAALPHTCQQHYCQPVCGSAALPRAQPATVLQSLCSPSPYFVLRTQLDCPVTTLPHFECPAAYSNVEWLNPKTSRIFLGSAGLVLYKQHAGRRCPDRGPVRPSIRERNGPVPGTRARSVVVLVLLFLCCTTTVLYKQHAGRRCPDRGPVLVGPGHMDGGACFDLP